jgi:hypothetical protein
MLSKCYVQLAEYVRPQHVMCERDILAMSEGAEELGLPLHRNVPLQGLCKRRDPQQHPTCHPEEWSRGNAELPAPTATTSGQ